MKIEQFYKVNYMHMLYMSLITIYNMIYMIWLKKSPKECDNNDMNRIFGILLLFLLDFESIVPFCNGTFHDKHRFSKNQWYWFDCIDCENLFDFRSFVISNEEHTDITTDESFFLWSKRFFLAATNGCMTIVFFVFGNRNHTAT